MPKCYKWFKLQLTAIFFFLLTYISVTNMHPSGNNKQLIKDEQHFSDGKLDFHSLNLHLRVPLSGGKSHDN